jgi:hypothetical protein
MAGLKEVKEPMEEGTPMNVRSGPQNTNAII